MTPDRRACIIRRTSIAGAIAMIHNRRPVLKRVKRETGFSLQRIIEMAPNARQAALMAGCGHHTILRYKERWEI